MCIFLYVCETREIVARKYLGQTFPFSHTALPGVLLHLYYSSLVCATIYPLGSAADWIELIAASFVRQWWVVPG